MLVVNVRGAHLGSYRVAASNADRSISCNAESVLREMEMKGTDAITTTFLVS